LTYAKEIVGYSNPTVLSSHRVLVLVLYTPGIRGCAARQLIPISGEISWLSGSNPLHNHSLFLEILCQLLNARIAMLTE
jgi:hypothetical protein